MDDFGPSRLEKERFDLPLSVERLSGCAEVLDDGPVRVCHHQTAPVGTYGTDFPADHLGTDHEEVDHVRHDRKRGTDMNLHMAACSGTGAVRKRHKRMAPMVQFRRSRPHGRTPGCDAAIVSRPG